MKYISLGDAIRKRIGELADNEDSLTALCLNSNLTPSTVFDFMHGKSKYPKIITLKKLCTGAGITLKEFFDREYFDNDEDVY